jgi:hypothetical protein
MRFPKDKPHEAKDDAMRGLLFTAFDDFSFGPDK